jgi:ribosomal-protein-serine acetyltransferase
MTMAPEIRTQRLVARLAREEDGPALGEAVAESLDQLSPWFQWAELLERWGDRGDYDARAVTAARRYELGEGPTYLLWAGERLVGEIALGAEDYDVLSYGVWVRRSAAGAGYAAEGSRAVLRAVLASGVEAVEARVDSSNFRSRRLLVAIGFRRHGWVRDLERYVLDAAALTPG